MIIQILIGIGIGYLFAKNFETFEYLPSGSEISLDQMIRLVNDIKLHRKNTLLSGDDYYKKILGYKKLTVSKDTDKRNAHEAMHEQIIMPFESMNTNALMRNHIRSLVHDSGIDDRSRSSKFY